MDCFGGRSFVDLGFGVGIRILCLALFTRTESPAPLPHPHTHTYTHMLVCVLFQQKFSSPSGKQGFHYWPVRVDCRWEDQRRSVSILQWCPKCAFHNYVYQLDTQNCGFSFRRVCWKLDDASRGDRDGQGSHPVFLCSVGAFEPL